MSERRIEAKDLMTAEHMALYEGFYTSVNLISFLGGVNHCSS